VLAAPSATFEQTIGILRLRRELRPFVDSDLLRQTAASPADPGKNPPDAASRLPSEPRAELHPTLNTALAVAFTGT